MPYVAKSGKTKERNGSSPIRESVVNIKPDTTMDDLQKYTERVHVHGRAQAFIPTLGMKYSRAGNKTFPHWEQITSRNVIEDEP